MSSLRTRIASAAVVLCALTAMTACGNEGDDTTAQDPTTSDSSPEPTSDTPTPTETSTDASGHPACSAVWVDGQDLPEDYKACVSEAGDVVKPTKRMCGFGVPLLEQDNRYYAMRGKPVDDVGDLTTSEDYQQLLASCQG